MQQGEGQGFVVAGVSHLLVPRMLIEGRTKLETDAGGENVLYSASSRSEKRANPEIPVVFIDNFRYRTLASHQIG
jgi:hypothetical protein